MSLAGFRRRIAKLEQKLRRQREPQFVLASFALWTDRLPEGTLVPPGCRVVEDFHAFHDRGAGGALSGYRRERITADPDDQGKIIYPDDEPGDPT